VVESAYSPAYQAKIVIPATAGIQDFSKLSGCPVFKYGTGSFKAGMTEKEL
jgi:hypothetical protein